MAEDQLSEQERNLADRVREVIESENPPDHWPAQSPNEVRRFELSSHIRIFRGALLWLKNAGRHTIPGVTLKSEALPSNPSDPNLLFSSDPTSKALRRAWAAHRRKSAPPDLAAYDSGVVEIPLTNAARVFSEGMAVALNAMTTAGAAVVNFTVNSTYTGYLVHVTERYWYSPHVFSSTLTTPASGALFPADYRFGGEKPGAATLWDYGNHKVSPTHTSTRVTRF